MSSGSRAAAPAARVEVIERMAYEMQFGPVLARAPELVDGAINTLILSSQSIAAGVAIGVIGAVARVEGPRWLGALVATYVEAFRNTPLLVQLFLIFFGLPLVGFRFSANGAALLAISLNLGAYSTEIVRAGLLAIPRTQVEAGLALGMSRFQVIRYIVLVPALRIIYPALTGQLTLTLLGTSMASAISADGAHRSRQQDRIRNLPQPRDLPRHRRHLHRPDLRLPVPVLGDRAVAVPPQGPRAVHGGRHSGRESSSMIRSFGWDSIVFLLRAAEWTLLLSLTTFVVGGFFGLVFALLRTLGPRPVRLAIAGYIQLVQATPLLVLVFLAFYGLSFLGLFFPPLIAAGLSLSIYTTAFLADIWRGCIEAIPRQQWEAATALSLSRSQNLRYVILPQAFKIALGPTVGFMVQIVKNTSVTALIGFVELTRAGQLLNNMTFQPFAVFMTVAAIYFVICYPLSFVSERLKGKGNVQACTLEASRSTSDPSACSTACRSRWRRARSSR